MGRLRRLKTIASLSERFHVRDNPIQPNKDPYIDEEQKILFT